jgi:hypothetical protein
MGGLTGHIQAGSSPIFHPPIPSSHVNLEDIKTSQDLDLFRPSLADHLLEFGKPRLETINLRTPSPIPIPGHNPTMNDRWDKKGISRASIQDFSAPVS